MLEQVLDYIHNYFVRKVVRGSFTITDGKINVELLDGQYFKIVGSVFNDGVHNTYDNLTDEEFRGEVWAMGVPNAILEIANEIDDWMDKYGAAINSPYQSESFGGYSYSKASAGGNGNSGGTASWQEVFGRRLNQWRKVNSDFVI